MTARTVEPNGAEYGTLMECGHAANALHGPADGERHWCCVICSMSGLPGDASCTVAANPPDLSTRVARCTYYGADGTRNRSWECNYGQKRGVCTCEQPSAPSKRLAFFKSKPDAEFDEFYCGCFGWD